VRGSEKDMAEAANSPLDSVSIRGLRTRIVGSVVNFHGQVTSTNDLARELAKADCNEGSVVVASSQTEGRGRFDRKWTSAEGGLYLSVVLRPELTMDEVTPLPLLAGLAVSKAISTTSLIETNLKWPNDVLIDGSKVGGVLMESSSVGERMEWVVLGAGMNVNNSIAGSMGESSMDATSLIEYTGKTQDLGEMLRNTLYFLDLIYVGFLQGSITSLLEQWTARSSTVGRRVRVEQQNDTIRGRALGVDERGCLLVKSGPEIIRITSGDCFHLR